LTGCSFASLSSKDLSSGKAHHSRPFEGVVFCVEKVGEAQRRMAERDFDEQKKGRINGLFS